MNEIPCSYPEIGKNEALKLSHDLCHILLACGVENDLVTLHKAGKQLTSLYFDCKTHRLILSEHLIKIEFLEYAVKTLKQLNNLGVFQNDDIWFASFYLYNLCWNYSTINPEFGSGLMLCGIESLLISNITHDPYINNLSKRNVNYLISATLSIMNNILKTPGYRLIFSTENVIKGLIKISKFDDKIAVLCTMCLSYIATNDNIKSTSDFDIFYNVKVLFYCIDRALETDGKYNNYTVYEFFEVLKFASLSNNQKDAIVNLDGFNIMIEQLNTTKDERVKREILFTLVNLCDAENGNKIKEIADFYSTNKSNVISSAVKTLSWFMEILEQKSKQNNNKLGKISRKKNIFINFAKPDERMAMKIFTDLMNGPNLPLIINDDEDVDKLRQAYDKSSIIIVCVSEAFKNSINLKVGAEYISLKNKIIFPVLIQNNYKPEGWIKDFIYQVSDVCYNFTQCFEENMDKFLVALNSQLTALKAECKEAVKEGPPIKAVVQAARESKPCNISQWLIEHDLSHLQAKMINISMELLCYMRKIRSEAPDFYFRSLQDSLKLNFVEIIQFSAALDELK